MFAKYSVNLCSQSQLNVISQLSNFAVVHQTFWLLTFKEKFHIQIQDLYHFATKYSKYLQKHSVNLYDKGFLAVKHVKFALVNPKDENLEKEKLAALHKKICTYDIKECLI